MQLFKEESMVQASFLKPTPKSAQKAGIFLSTFFSLALFASTGTEVLKNGDFSLPDTTPWALQRFDSAAVTAAIANGQYVITRANDAKAGDTNSYGIQLMQKPIKIEKGKTYSVSYAVKADSSFSITAYIGVNLTPWYAYSSYNQAIVTKTPDTFSFEFSMDSATDTLARIAFDLGFMRTKGTITFDFISVIGKAAVVPPQQGELIKNGDFSSTSLGNWNLTIRSGANSKATKKVVNGELQVDITKMCTPLDSAQGWDVQLNQTGLKLEKGKQYQVTWDARSNFPFQMACYVAMNKTPWGIYSSYYTFMVGEDMDTTQLLTFTMGDTADPGARIGFDLGDMTDTTPRTLYFDNISLQCLDCNVGVVNAATFGKQSSRLRAILKDRRLSIAGVSSPASIGVFNASGKSMPAVEKAAPGKGMVSVEFTRGLAKGVYFAIVKQWASSSAASIKFINQ
jgi:hypothetical protein